MAVSEKDLERLALYIVEEIKKDFVVKKLSGNLVNTIRIEKNNGEIKVVIPAEMYDLKIFSKNKSIVYTGKGSYASTLNEKGSFKGNHKGYIDRAVDAAIIRWTRELGAPSTITAR